MRLRKREENVDIGVFEIYLTLISILLVVSALWIGIWVFATSNWVIADEALSFIYRAVCGQFAGENAYIASILGIMFYLSLMSALLFIIFSLIYKKYKGITGSFSFVLNVAVLVFQIAFFVRFIFELSGMFTVVLAFFILCEIIVLAHTFKLLLLTAIPILAKDKESFRDEKAKETPEIIGQYIAPKEENKEEKKEEKKANEPKEKPAEELPVNSDDKRFNIKILSFEEKLRKATKETREKFKDIKAYFESLGFKASTTKFGETFVYKNVKYAQITTMGKNGLKIYYKLNFKDYATSTIPVEDLSDKKKYEKLPVMFRVKSDLSVKRAKKLMDDVLSSIKD